MKRIYIPLALVSLVAGFFLAVRLDRTTLCERAIQTGRADVIEWNCELIYNANIHRFHYDDKLTGKEIPFNVSWLR